MSPAELKASVRLQCASTLNAMRKGLLSRANEARNDIAASSDLEQLQAIDWELNRRLIDQRLLDGVWPIRSCLNHRGEEGYAVHGFNVHSRVFQPVGSWKQSYDDAALERAEIVSLMSYQAEEA